MRLFTDEETKEEFRKALAGEETYRIGKCDNPTLVDGIWDHTKPCGGKEKFLGIAHTSEHGMVYARFQCPKRGRKSEWPTGFRHKWHPGCRITWNGTAFVCGGKVIK